VTPYTIIIQRFKEDGVPYCRATFAPKEQKRRTTTWHATEPTAEEWDAVATMAGDCLAPGRSEQEQHAVGAAWAYRYVSEERPGGIPAWLEVALVSFDASVVGALLLAAIGPATVSALLASAKANAASQLSALRPALESAVKLGLKGAEIMAYDWKKGLAKAGKALLVAAAAGALGAVANGAGLDDLKALPILGPVVAGAVVAIATWGWNWLKTHPVV